MDNWSVEQSLCIIMLLKTREPEKCVNQRRQCKRNGQPAATGRTRCPYKIVVPFQKRTICTRRKWTGARPKPKLNKQKKKKKRKRASNVSNRHRNYYTLEMRCLPSQSIYGQKKQLYDLMPQPVLLNTSSYSIQHFFRGKMYEWIAHVEPFYEWRMFLPFSRRVFVFFFCLVVVFCSLIFLCLIWLWFGFGCEPFAGLALAQ